MKKVDIGHSDKGYIIYENYLKRKRKGKGKRKRKNTKI